MPSTPGLRRFLPPSRPPPGPHSMHCVLGPWRGGGPFPAGAGGPGRTGAASLPFAFLICVREPRPPDGCGGLRDTQPPPADLRDSRGRSCHSSRACVPVLAEPARSPVAQDQAVPGAASRKSGRSVGLPWAETPAPPTPNLGQARISGNSFRRRNWWSSVGGTLWGPPSSGLTWSSFGYFYARAREGDIGSRLEA